MMDDRFGGPPPPRGGGGYGGGGYGGPPPRGGGYDRPPPSRAGTGHRIQISGIKEGTSWQDLKDFARSAGHVTFADIDKRDPTLGFIEYGSARDAEDAVRKLDGTDLMGAVVTVTADGPPASR